jgi:hypothetical protein
MYLFVLTFAFACGANQLLFGGKWFWNTLASSTGDSDPLRAAAG